MATETAQVVVYGNTWAAVNAACAAAIRGASVALVSPYANIGGIIGNGLGAIDLGRYGTHGIGWLTNEFFRRQATMYGTSMLLIRSNPSAAETIFSNMLKFYGVRVRVGRVLDTVSMTGTTINSFATTDGTVFAGTNFIDCTEEGDLAKMAGVTMVVGRESAATYGEPCAGFFPVESSFTPFDCYASPGVLLNGFSPYPAMVQGDADGGVQSYGFRLCVTQNVSNKRAWPKPAGYDETLFEHLRRGIPNDPDWKPFSVSACLDNKGDRNADFGVPQNWEWPNATPARRVEILQSIYAEQAGWHWFLANDPSILPEVQDWCNSWGPAVDEFTDGGITAAGWPNELYVRIGRRMVGQYVMKQSDTQVDITKTDNVSIDFYSLDHHTAQYLAVTRNGVAGYIIDQFGAGVSSEGRQVTPYHRPFRAMLPLTSQCVNLLVPVACSASNVAMSSMRIDIHKANFASAGGLAAGKSAMTATPINALVIADLQADLDGYGQVRAYTPP